MEPRRKKFGVFAVRPRTKELVNVGDAFENREGSIELYLSAMPVDGHLRLLEIVEGDGRSAVEVSAEQAAIRADLTACKIAQSVGQHKASCRHCRRQKGEAV